MIRSSLIFAWLLLWVFSCNTSADEVTIVHNGSHLELEGEILIETQNDNGLLFQSRDGKLWVVEQEQLKEKSADEKEVAPFKKDELAKQLKEEMGDGFRVHDAGNFVIAYNTSQPYARWVAGLYRKLERGFDFYWSRNKFKLDDRPEFPLPIIIFKNRAEYERYMKKDIGVVTSMLAYYSLESNRVIMFDLTADTVPPGANLNERKIGEVLDNPRAIPMVATIIHEGTHQLMFNYGMQTRYADTPLWINEGLAAYFETPDLGAKNGWRKIGKVNFLRLGPFLQFAKNRPADSLKKMMATDDGFKNASTLDNYAQAWAFNYFLLNRHKKAYVKYLSHMSEKPRLVSDEPEQRISEFLQFFDQTLEELDKEFLRYIRKLN